MPDNFKTKNSRRIHDPFTSAAVCYIKEQSHDVQPPYTQREADGVALCAPMAVAAAAGNKLDTPRWHHLAIVTGLRTVIRRSRLRRNGRLRISLLLYDDFSPSSIYRDRSLPTSLLISACIRNSKGDAVATATRN